MKAMVLKGFGGVENFSLEEIPRPTAGAGELLIEIKAIGIDRIDLKTREGRGMASYLEKEDPMILGWDLAGVVAVAGAGVKDFEAGDEVFGTVNFPGPGSTYAEYAAAPAAQLARKPADLSFEEAAAATQSPLTAWQALVEAGKMRRGQTVLIHGGAGGVGHYAVQIARIFGCRVIATASAAQKEFVASLGAEEVIDFESERFEERVHGVDLVLDTIGGENFVRSLQVLKRGGTIVLLPSDKREEAEKALGARSGIRFRPILMHSSGRDMRQIAALLAGGGLKVHVDRIFPFGQLPEAHEALESGQVKGKVAVTMRERTEM